MNSAIDIRSFCEFNQAGGSFCFFVVKDEKSWTPKWFVWVGGKLPYEEIMGKKTVKGKGVYVKLKSNNKTYLIKEGATVYNYNRKDFQNLRKSSQNFRLVC